jgi:hypothetical protein
MKKDSLFTSDRCAGFATKLKGGCEMFQGSLINRLARSVASFVLVAAIGHFTAARVEGKQEDPAHQGILNSVESVQTTVNSVATNLGDVQTTVNSVATKVDAIKSKLDLIPPAWSQILPGADRFPLVMGGAAALDRETGLVWDRSPDATTRTWFNALIHCYQRDVGGRKGWRLPTIEELASLVDPNNPTGNPDLPPGHPFSNVQSFVYWSATTSVGLTSAAWVVILINGIVDSANKTDPLLVWCVRGGQGIDGVQ